MFERVGRNVLSNWTGLAVSMVVAFFMSPFLVHTLGDAQYGVWVLILSVTGYMGLLDAGLKVSVVKFVAGLAAKDDDDALGSIISTVLAIYGLLAIPLLAGAAGVGLALDELFEMPAELEPTARITLLIAGATLSVTLLASVFNGFFAGLQRYDVTNAVHIGATLVGAGAIYVVVSRGMGIVGLALVHLCLQAASGLLLCVLALRMRPQVRIGAAQVRFSTVRQLYGYSVFVLLNSLAMLLLFRSGELVAGLLFGAGAVTYFAIGGMLVEYLGKIIGSMTQVLQPLASGQHARGDETGLRTAVLLSTRACLAITLPACAGFIVLGDPFIATWMNPGYAEVSAPILVVLAVARLFWLAQSGSGNILLGGGRHRELTLFNGATGVAGIVLAIIAANQLGLIGVAVGLAIAITVCQGLLMPAYLCRSLKIPVAAYLREAVAGPVLAAVPFGAAMVLFANWLRPDGFGDIAVVVFTCAPIYLVAAYCSCLDAGHRAQLAAFISRRRDST